MLRDLITLVTEKTTYRAFLKQFPPPFTYLLSQLTLCSSVFCCRKN